jgi:hypothetical protein
MAERKRTSEMKSCKTPVLGCAKERDEKNSKIKIGEPFSGTSTLEDLRTQSYVPKESCLKA